MPRPAGKNPMIQRRKSLVRIGNITKPEMLGLLEKGGFRIAGPAFERAMGKTVFDMQRNGEIVPVYNVAAKLGLSRYVLHLMPDLRRFRVGKCDYVTAIEAKRFETAYLKGEQLRRQSEERARKREAERRLAAERAERREIERRLAAERAKKIKAEQQAETKRQAAAERAGERRKLTEQRRQANAAIKAEEKRQANETKELISGWKRAIFHMPAGGRKTMMLGLLSRNANLPPDKFRKKIEPVLNRLMEVANSQ